MRRALRFEIPLLALVLAAQAFLFGRLLHNATNYDEAVYLAAVDALRHGQALGSQVFAAQFPGFYDLLRGLSFLFGVSVTGIRVGLLCLMLLGSVGGWLVGRHFGGPVGGLLTASFLTIAPPLDLFGSQVIADAPALALTVASLGIATLTGPLVAVAAGLVFGAALSVKLTALTALPALAWILRGRILLGLAGFGVAIAAVLLAHARALHDLWASDVTYHRDASSTPAVIPHPHRQIFEQIPHTTPFFILAVCSVVVGLALFGLRRRFPVWPLWSWVALSLLFLFLFKPLHYNHLIVFPYSLAVAAGATLGWAIHEIPPRVSMLVTAVVGVAVAGGYVQQVHRVDAARTPEPKTNLEAARALDGVTPPDAIVADDRPIISFLAKRRTYGPLVDTAQLRFETGSLTNQGVERDLHHIQAVVLSRTLLHRPAIRAYVASHFRLRARVGTIRIYTR